MHPFVHAMAVAADDLLAAVTAWERDPNELTLLAVREARQPFADALAAVRGLDLPAGREVWNEETERVEPPIGMRRFADAALFEPPATGLHRGRVLDACGPAAAAK